MTTYPGTANTVRSGGVWQIVRALLARGRGTLLAWQRCHRERHDLLSLNGRLQEDVGLSRAAVARSVKNRSGLPACQMLRFYWMTWM
jgi:uncharacterized protein YjiS (DUF1127 family)